MGTWAQGSHEVASWADTDVRLGLTADEAADRLGRYGPNELETTDAASLWRRIGRQFTDPLVLLLLAAIVISALAWVTDGRNGAPLEAIVIAAIVIANAAIGTWQEDRAIKAVAALRHLAGTHSTVVRDGRSRVVATTDLVPGDLLLLAQGDAVGADCRLVECAAMAVAEASLTGESTPVEKMVDPLPASTPLPERTNMAYRGTAVASGRGVGVVVATGMESEIGRIARLIDDADQHTTPLERQVEWLGRTLGVVVVILATIVVGTIVVTSDVSTFADVVQASLVGVSLAVAAVPEGLPAILTIVLAMGVQRMAENKAIVKRLSSVETLGAASVICTDKTGTLTRNEMTIVTVVVPSGRVEVSGVGYEPSGELRSGDHPVDDADLSTEVELVISAGSIANDASLVLDDSGRWEVRGDPTEIAFLVAEQKLGLREHRLDHVRRVDEIPFDSDRKLMTTVNDYSSTVGFGGHAAERMVFTKGAPDVLIDRCRAERVGGTIRSLTAERRAELVDHVDELADRALRTLAVAYRPIDESESDREGHETGLIMLGIVGIIDPPRAEAQAAIRSAHEGGVRVIMITGDHPRTAARIAAHLDLADAGRRVVTGSELSAIDDDALGAVVMETDVFARVDPEHKLRLVRALQHNGQIVAMTGDGVNDAPALKQADIGVAMGVSGTEVSKEAADMILADDNFATILRAVREGREIFADIRKFLRYLLASNTGEVLVVFLGVLFAAELGLVSGAELAVPLLATQILWINLVTDGVLALALGVDPAVENVMDRPPRRLTERVIDPRMLVTIVLVGVVTALVSLVAFDLESAGGLLGGSGDVETARTMTFTTLVLAQVCNAFTARSDTVSVVVDAFANRLLWAAAAVTVLAQVLVVHLPGLSAAFDTEPLTVGEWAICAGLAGLVLVAAELLKLSRRTAARRVAV